MNFYHRLLAFVLCVVVLPLFAQPPDNFYTIPGVYANAGSLTGDTVFVMAYYSTPGDSLILDNYNDRLKRHPFPPQSVGVLVGTPPADMWYGGLMYIEGVVNFVPRTEFFHPEDTVLLYLTMLNVIPIFSGDSSVFLRSAPEIEPVIEEEAECDSCKFALLISGGVSRRDWCFSFWSDLEKTYSTKVSGEGYCPENIYINYFHGVAARTTVIDTAKAKIKSATLANVRAHIDSIAKKIAACKRAGKRTEFQKMVSNHGTDGPPPGICLLGNNIIPPESLFRWEQEIIDSGCDRMIDVFTQCFGGYLVDTLKKLNPRDSCEINITSSVDRRASWGPTRLPHKFGEAFLDSIARGHSPNRAAVEAKLAYDNYIRNKILPYLHEEIARLDSAYMAAPIGSREEDTLLDKLLETRSDSVEAYASICESPIVKTIKMRSFCQMETVWVPPGGQLVLDFKGDPSNCGNVTVWQDSAGHLVRKKQWNFNLAGGGVRRVANARADSITMFVIHNDDNSYSITATSLGGRRYDETPENRADYAVVSFGGRDDSGSEFGFCVAEVFEVFDADAMDFDLTNMPSLLGPEGVQILIVHFNPPGYNDYWNDMEVFIIVSQVFAPGELEIRCDAAEHSLVGLHIDEPGIYTAHLGAIAFDKSPFDIQFSATGSFEWDSWALRSITPTGVEEDHRWTNAKPYSVALHRNYPQPFNSSTVIQFDIPEDLEGRLEVLDILGRVIMTPLQGLIPAGHHTVRVDLSGYPSGVYFYRLTTPQGVFTRRMTLIK